jgi:hypothetical protein
LQIASIAPDKLPIDVRLREPLADVVPVVQDLIQDQPVFVAFWDFRVVVAVVWVVNVWVDPVLDDRISIVVRGELGGVYLENRSKVLWLRIRFFQILAQQNIHESARHVSYNFRW